MTRHDELCRMAPDLTPSPLSREERGSQSQRAV